MSKYLGTFWTRIFLGTFQKVDLLRLVPVSGEGIARRNQRKQNLILDQGGKLWIYIRKTPEGWIVVIWYVKCILQLFTACMYIVRDVHGKAPMYVHFMRYPLNAGPTTCLQCIPWGITKLFHSFYSSNFQHGCTSILICTEHHTSLQPGKTSKNWQFGKESGKILCTLVAPQIEFGDRDNFLSPGLSSYYANERFDWSQEFWA